MMPMGFGVVKYYAVCFQLRQHSSPKAYWGRTLSSFGVLIKADLRGIHVIENVSPEDPEVLRIVPAL